MTEDAASLSSRQDKKEKRYPLAVWEGAVSPAAGLNLKKLSSRHLKVFTPDKVLSWAVSKNLKKKKKTCVAHVPDVRGGGGAQEHFQTADVSIKITAASSRGTF